MSSEVGIAVVRRNTEEVQGVRDKEAISPGNWNIDQPLLDRPVNAEIQLAFFCSCGSNPPLCPKWQASFRFAPDSMGVESTKGLTGQNHSTVMVTRRRMDHENSRCVRTQSPPQ